MTRSSLCIQEDPPPHCDNTPSAPRTSRSSRANPAASPFSSSDKENSSSAKPDKGCNGKESRNGNTRLSELNPSQRLHNRILEEEADRDSYDPDQDPEERRRVKREYRTLHRKLQDSKQEYLQPNSTGIKDTFLQADELFKNVKQTSDATLDSRLLVAAADLTLKKATNLTFGKGGISIDTDEFVGKCMTFMRSRGGEVRQRSQGEDDDDDADDDEMDWARLGREAAFKGNKRPAATDFLLGPMSVTKRIRLVKQRRQGLKRGNATMVRPVEIENNGEEKGPENNANTSLRLVRSIHTVLEEYFFEHPEIADTGLNLFKAVVNPNSFGQTIENIFYISFLVKDGFICIQEDDDDLPVMFMADPPGAEDRQTMTVNRSQVIFSMTMHHWQQAIKVFDIDRSIIPTRETQPESVGVTGWYS